MNAFSRNLLLLVGGTSALIAVSAGSTYLVKYKPWGVPDVLRDKYEAKVAAVEQRNQLIDFWEAKPQPSITVRSFYDVDARPDQSEESFHFSLRNDGDLPLKIGLMRSSNDATFAVSSQLIEPGDEAEVIVSWTTPAIPGPFEFQAFFESNDPLNRRFTITFRGRVKAKILIPRTVSYSSTNVGELAHTSLVINSELWDTFEIVDVSSGVESIEWNAKSIRPSSEIFTSSTELTLMQRFFEFGKHQNKVLITAKGPLGETITTEVSLKGKVNLPIRFLGPELHMTDGLDLGTIISGERQSFYLNCRVQGDLNRQISVLGIEPQVLQAELTEQSIVGNYRLSIIVPEDCPRTIFNTNRQGYVKVGDPNDETFSNWLPLHGVVIPPIQK